MVLWIFTNIHTVYVRGFGSGWTTNSLLCSVHSGSDPRNLRNELWHVSFLCPYALTKKWGARSG